MKKLLKNYSKYLLVVCLFIIMLSAVAQVNESGFRVISKNYGDSVVLRWAPVNMLMWQQYLKGGFFIERAVIDSSSNRIETGFTRIHTDTIKPWSLMKMESRIPRENRYIAIAAQALYGKTFNTIITAPAMSQQAITQAQQQESRYAYALFAADHSAVVAQALGLRFADKPISKRKIYLYRIIGFYADGKIKSDTALISVRGSQIDMLLPAPSLTIQSGDHSNQLSWQISLGESYSGFYVERSEDIKKFIRLNKIPLALTLSENGNNQIMYYTDSLNENYKLYTYRLIGVDAFADETPPSETSAAFGKDLTAPESVFLIEARTTDFQNVRLKWKKDKLEKDLKGYIVERSENIDGPFKNITPTSLKKTDTLFIDKKSDIYSENFYRVVSIDTARNESISNTVYTVIVDNKPPSKPVGLKGKIDSTGVVRLSWLKGKERDLDGYRVYMANQSDHEFLTVSPRLITDTLYNDTITLKTLTKKVYYKIAAIDKNKNVSPLSEVLELKRPDIIAPAPGLFTNYKVGDSSVFIEAVLSPSSDINKHVLIRRTENAKWDTIAVFKKTIKTISFIDKKVLPATKYEYQLIAFDESNLYTFADKSLIIKIPANMQKPIPTNLRLSYDKGKKTILLQWNYEAKGDGYYYVIYRSYNNSPITTYATFSTKNNSFEDKQLYGKGTYQYAIKAVYRAGGESNMTKKVILNVAE